MKKLLIGTSALVAAGLVAGAAHAADPIKLNVGGFAGSWVTFADQDDAFMRAGGFAAGSESNAVDVRSDVEVIFTGSTTLDNGLKVSFKTEMEAGGRATANVIDEYHISVAGSFGTVVMGADDTALAAIAVTSPRVGGRLHGGAFSEGDVVGGGVILAPTTVGMGAPTNTTNVPNASFVNTGGDSESISYISPSFAGFTVGATYMPDVAGGRNNVAWPAGAATSAIDAYGIGAAYAGEFSGVGVKVAGGWLTADHSGTDVLTGSTIDNHDEYQVGASLSYAGFTFGGGYRVIDQNLASLTAAGAAVTDRSRDGRAWDLGVSYKTGPYGVSLAYFDASREQGANVGDDKAKVWELNGEYSMGPGVSLVGGFNYAKFENGVAAGVAKTAADENKGFAVSSGISLSF